MVRGLNYFVDGGRQWLTENWKLCDPLKSQDDINTLKNWLINVYGNLAMVDYPYPANFLAPLPGFPIKVSKSFNTIVTFCMEFYRLLLKVCCLGRL